MKTITQATLVAAGAALLLLLALPACHLLEQDLLPTPAGGAFPCSNPYAAPDSVARQAQLAYGACQLPRLTVAFAYPGTPLEAGWTFAIGDDFYSTNPQGFFFLEDIAPGTYWLDNRQGGWFDYVCGPQSESITIEATGSQLVFVELWCE